MEKVKKGLFWTVVASESIHVFCCVLPTIFSVLSLMAGLGMISTIPGVVEEVHEIMHEYEIPMIIVSAVVLIFGWMVYAYSRFLSCSAEGSTCCHEPCAPKKDRTKLFMIIATGLFIVNASVYFIFHKPMDDHGYEQERKNY